jgi:hypothetical protein
VREESGVMWRCRRVSVLNSKYVGGHGRFYFWWEYCMIGFRFQIILFSESIITIVFIKMILVHHKQLMPHGKVFIGEKQCTLMSLFNPSLWVPG